MRLSRTPILEREEQRGSVTALARRACAGSGSAIVVEGPAGIGKTSFLAELAADAGALGMTVLEARGSEPEREFAFGVVRQLFEERVHSAPAAERRALLAGAARTVAPLLGARAGGPLAAPEGFAVMHGLYWLCANLAAHTPVLLLIDDAHWADEPSLRWLEFLGGRIDELPVLAVASTRSDEPPPEAPLLAEIRIDPRLHHVPLAPLSEGAVARLVRGRLGDDADGEFCRACHAATGGNPFYLTELLAELEARRIRPVAGAVAQVHEQGPETIVDAVLHRVTRPSSEAPSLARAIAVLGRGAELRIAAHLAGLDRETAARAADALAAMQILEPSGNLDFVHPIVRSAIYAEIPHWERARLHRRAAALLEGDGAVEAVAGQLLKSEPAEEAWTVHVLRDAAREALGRGAPEVGLVYLRRALAEPPSGGEQPAVLRELGQAAFLAGDPEGPDYLRRAEGLASDRTERGRAALALGMALAVADQVRDAVEVLQRAVRESIGDPEVAMALEAQLIAVSLMGPPDVAPARDRLIAWMQTEVPESPSGRMLLASIAAWAFSAGFPAARVRDLAERALGAGRLLAEVTCAGQPFYMAANRLTFADWLELGQKWLDQAIDQAGRLGSVVGFVIASCYRSDLGYRAGRLAEAEADALAALGAARKSAAPGHLPLVVGNALQVMIERGQLDTAAAILDDNWSSVGEGDTALQMIGRYHRGRLLVARGRLVEGLHDLLATGDWERRAGWRNPSYCPWRSQAGPTLAVLGRLDEARTLAWEEVHLARPLGQPRTLGMALRAAGLVEGGERGLELLQEALAVLANGPSLLEHARALVSLGSVHRRRGHRSDAQRTLKDGLDLAHRCGASVLVRSAQEELRLTGARPRRLRTSGLMALTAAERHVAQMAARGLSNAEIGQAQFVGLKTVETHLSRVYSKLGVTSRTELPAALARPLDE